MTWELQDGVLVSTQSPSYKASSKTTATVSEILIGGHSFTAIKSVNLGKEATVYKYRVESGSEVTDHIICNSPVFEFELDLLNDEDEYTTLNNLYTDRKPFTLTTHRGTFPNMIISKLSDVKSQSENSTTCTVTIQEVRVGKTDIVEIKNTAEVTTQTEENYPGGYTLKVLGKATVAATLPEKTTSQTGVGYCDTLTPNLASSTAFLNRRSS